MKRELAASQPRPPSLSCPTLLILCFCSICCTTALASGPDLCGNLTVRIRGKPLRWDHVAEAGIQPLPSTVQSYLRPETQVLLPWLYTLIILVVHIPPFIVRVVHWETVQIWCLAATFLTVLVYAQAYASTRLSAEQVLVWTPLLLPIDAASMVQIFFLISEDYHLWPRIVLALRRRSNEQGKLNSSHDYPLNC